MARRPEGWLIRQAQDGTCDVFFDRRPCVYDRDDLAEATSWVRRSPQWAGQPVVLEEPDGYQAPLRVGTW